MCIDWFNYFSVLSQKTPQKTKTSSDFRCFLFSESRKQNFKDHILRPNVFIYIFIKNKSISLSILYASFSTFLTINYISVISNIYSWCHNFLIFVYSYAAT